MAKVTYIPATINPATRLPTIGIHKRRTAGYARVSTDKDEQFTSYEAQVDYYTKYIKEHSDWEFVKVYTDEGISGTSTKKREGFNEMIEDALAGKIDLIVTKSVSRFARNTVDSLTTIRKLKEKGVEVFFEKENIWTLDSKGELLLTIMSSLAQEESRSISENVTWGKRKRASDGKVSLAYKHFLGYDKGPNDTLIINPEQAVIVKRIYRDFMQGKTSWTIANELTDEGIPTPCGKSKWRATTVESILTNEKYKGAALLQKTFTVDYLSKKIKANEGEVPQYYVEDSHEAIIPPDEWERVQKEIARRRSLGKKYSGNSIFATRIVCGDCGAFYGTKVWNSTDERYRRVIWQCNDKFKGEERCKTPHVTEEQVKQKFVEAFNRLFDDKAEIIANCEMIATMLTDTRDIEDERNALLREIEIVTELTHKLVEENASTAQNQTDYLATYNGYVERYNQAVERLQSLEQAILVKKAKADAFEAFIQTMSLVKGQLTEFDDMLWVLTIEQVRIMQNHTMCFVFQNGSEIIL